MILLTSLIYDKIKLDDNIKYEFYMDKIIPETNELRRIKFIILFLIYFNIIIG